MEHDYLELSTDNICDIDYIPFESLNYRIEYQICRISNINNQVFVSLDTQKSIFIHTFMYVIYCVKT